MKSNFSGISVEERMIATSFRSTGFDYLRLFLACGVICVHTLNVNLGIDAAVAIALTSWRPLIAFILPMFFALSGFLVAGSLFRCRSLIGFLGLRAIRIIPALAVEVVVSALIIGPIFTAYPLKDYFFNSRFATYFFNVIGYIHYKLPGVFLGNPWPEVVNGQLWTVPYELKCYILLAVLGAIGMVWKRTVYLLALSALQVGLVIYVLTVHPPQDPVVAGDILVLCFLWGIAFYIYRDAIKLNTWLFIASAISIVALLLTPGGDYLVAVPATYATVYLGLLNPKKPPFFFAGDYSYGMYLYGFPIQQAVATLSPLHHYWYLNILLSLPITFAVANVSWWLVEKPALRLRARVMRVEASALALIPGQARALIEARAV